MAFILLMRIVYFGQPVFWLGGWVDLTVFIVVNPFFWLGEWVYLIVCFTTIFPSTSHAQLIQLKKSVHGSFYKPKEKLSFNLKSSHKHSGF